jgi:hypothetical protein
MGSLQAAIGRLDGTEELVLELVRGGLVEQLVGVAECAEGQADVVGRRGEGVEHLALGLGGDVCHGPHGSRERPKAPHQAGPSNKETSGVRC